MINLALIIVLSLACATVVFLGPFASRMQVTTLWVGRKIAPEDMESELPRGFQDAITPKLQDTLNTVLPIAYLLIIVLGSIKAWYLGVALLVGSLILRAVVQKFYSNKINFYFRIINYYMANKIADYHKDKDVLRAEAATEMMQKLGNFYLSIKDQDLIVPKMSEAKGIPFGWESL